MMIIAIFVFAIAINFGSSVNDNTYTSYNNEIICNPAYPTEYPTTIEEVQAIILKSIALKTTVKAYGSRHSVMDTICTAGTTVNMRGVAHMTIDDSTKRVVVGAGVQVADFFKYLELNGRALIGSTSSYGGVTIGGALGTGARGTSLLLPVSFSDQIIAVTIVDGRGQVQRIKNDHPDFDAFRVHLGLLGIIIDATFDTVSAYKMRMENYITGESILFNGVFAQMARQYDWLQAWWFPSSSDVVVSKGTNVPFSTAGNASTYMIPDMKKLTVLLLRTAFEQGQALRSQLVMNTIELWAKLSLYSKVPLRPPVFSNDGFTLTNPAVGYVHNLMQNRCTKCVWHYGKSGSIYQAETGIAVDWKHFSAIVRSIRDILLNVTSSFPAYGIFIRVAPKSSALMSVGYGRETVHIEIVTTARVDPFNSARFGLGAVQAIEQTLMYKFGGRPHWSMCGQSLHTSELMERNCPNIEQFRKCVRKYDPQGIFLNNFGKRVMGVANTLTIDPRTKHCALQENCVCQKNSDCASGQICSKVNGFNVCKDRSLVKKVLGRVGGLLGSLTSDVKLFLGRITPKN